MLSHSLVVVDVVVDNLSSTASSVYHSNKKNAIGTPQTVPGNGGFEMTLLKQILKIRNMSQNSLAYATKIPPSNLSLIANGKLYPCPSWRKRISEALGVPEEVLFSQASGEVG